MIIELCLKFIELSGWNLFLNFDQCSQLFGTLIDLPPPLPATGLDHPPACLFVPLKYRKLKIQEGKVTLLRFTASISHSINGEHEGKCEYWCIAVVVRRALEGGGEGEESRCSIIKGGNRRKSWCCTTESLVLLLQRLRLQLVSLFTGLILVFTTGITEIVFFFPDRVDKWKGLFTPNENSPIYSLLSQWSEGFEVPNVKESQP